MIIHRVYSQPLWSFCAHKHYFSPNLFMRFPQNMMFPPTRGSVNSPRTAITISRAFKALEYINGCCLITFPCSSGDWSWSDTTSCPSLATPENRSSDVHEQSNSYRTITIRRKPTKRFIDWPPNTISERWRYATAVLGWLRSQSCLICQFWPPKHQNMDSISCRFVSVSRDVTTIDISLACQIIDITTGHALMLFRYILCLVLLFAIVPFGWREPRKKLPKWPPRNFRGSPNCHQLAKTRETFHQCPTLYHIRGMIMSHGSYGPFNCPNYRDIAIFVPG